MPLPDFSSDGLLPAGRHRATVEEVRATLVEPFNDSTTRAAIFTFWEDRRAAVTELVDVVGEWLDGSFTTDKPDPADIDLVTIIDGPAFDDLPRHRRQVVASLVAGTTTEDFWYCDAGVVVHYPPEDLSHARSAVAAGCWAGYFGHTRDGTATGLVELVADGREPIEVALEDDEAEDGEAQLRAHLARFDEALQAFDDSHATQLPGLRLMATTLRSKRDELAGKLEASRQVEVRVSPLSGEPADGRAVAALLAAICTGATEIGQGLAADGVDPLALGRALQLRVVEGTADGAVLLRAGGAADRHAVGAPEGAESLVTAALHAYLDAIEGEEAEGATGAAATALREAVTRRAAPIALTLRWPFGEERQVEVTPASG